MAVRGRVKPKRKVRKKRVAKKKGLTHTILVSKGVKWLRAQGGKQWSAPVVFGEMVASGNEIPDVIGFSSGGSCLIECKTSKSDFKRDKKKMFRSVPQMGMGKYRFYMCPTGLIEKNELPDGWGLIYVNEKGGVKLIVKPKAQYCNLKAEHAYMYSIMRRTYKKKNNEIQTFFRRYT
jgi:hypothetical protein